jgi:hypothetical protein
MAIPWDQGQETHRDVRVARSQSTLIDIIEQVRRRLAF